MGRWAGHHRRRRSAAVVAAAGAAAAASASLGTGAALVGQVRHQPLSPRSPLRLRRETSPRPHRTPCASEISPPTVTTEPPPTATPQPPLREQEVLDDDAHMIASVGLSYDAEAIEAYFADRPEELSQHTLSVARAVAGVALPAAAAVASTWWRLNMSGKKRKEQEHEVAWSSVRAKLAPRVADGLSQLGPTYVKFGQALASRPDLVSAEIADELVRLQDDLPPFDGDMAWKILEQELLGRGAQGKELLASLDGAQPVAAASLGQVYKGRVGGKDVAVKVQRPEVRRTVVADAAVLKAGARAISSLRMPVPLEGSRAHAEEVVLEPVVRADLVGAVDEFCSRLFEELDYSREAANIERFTRLYGKDGEFAARIPSPGIRIPKLLPHLSSRRVLVMEWIDGERLLSSGQAAPNADKALLEVGIAATLMQLLETGVMHTDPHGGNILKSSSQLAYLDFGLIADVPLQVRDGLVCAVMYIVRRRWDRVASLFNQLMLLPDWVLQDKATLARFTADIEAASNSALDYSTVGPEGVPKLNFSALLEQLALLAPRYEFRLPPYFLNNARALGCLEGMARLADPDFNILRRMYPFALDRLLANPNSSPVLLGTLRDLARDEETGHLSTQRALELVDLAANLRGVERKEVLREFLDSTTGRRLAAEVVAGNCIAVADRLLTRGFAFVDHWATRARKHLNKRVRGKVMTEDELLAT